MTAISSLPALGPEAKNTAGSPGSTRINRKVKISTPNSAGKDDAKRHAARFAVVTMLVMTGCAARSLAAEVAVGDLAVELVGIALDRGGHHGILTRLPERDLRHQIEVDGVELPAVGFIFCLVGLETRLLRD